MKKVVVVVSVLLSSFILFSSFSSDTDISSQILEESREALAAVDDLFAEFTYQIENPGMQKPIAKTGELKYKQGKYNIKLPGQRIFCDTETVWIYLEEDQEVNILPYDPEEDGGVSPESVFDIYQTSAKTKYEGLEEVHGNSCHKVFLAISDPDLEYNRAYIWVNKKTKLLEKLSVINRNQTMTTYEFSQIKTNVGFSDGDFQLDVKQLPSGVEVYDER